MDLGRLRGVQVRNTSLQLTRGISFESLLRVSRSVVSGFSFFSALCRSTRPSEMAVVWCFAQLKRCVEWRQCALIWLHAWLCIEKISARRVHAGALCPCSSSPSSSKHDRRAPSGVGDEDSDDESRMPMQPNRTLTDEAKEAREEIQVLEALLTELQRNHQSIVDRERQLERTFDEIRSSPEAMSREDEEYLQNVYPQTLASVRAAIQESQEKMRDVEDKLQLLRRSEGMQTVNAELERRGIVADESNFHDVDADDGDDAQNGSDDHNRRGEEDAHTVDVGQQQQQIASSSGASGQSSTTPTITTSVTSTKAAYV